MLAVTFAASGGGNCVVVVGERYVLARTGGQPFLLAASCPHRGGPLPLGDIDGDGRLVCPWHENRYSCTRSRESTIPLVRRANQVTAIFPNEESTAYTTEYQPVSKGLIARRPPASMDLARVD